MILLYCKKIDTHLNIAWPNSVVSNVQRYSGRLLCLLQQFFGLTRSINHSTCCKIFTVVKSYNLYRFLRWQTSKRIVWNNNARAVGLAAGFRSKQLDMKSWRYKCIKLIRITSFNFQYQSWSNLGIKMIDVSLFSISTYEIVTMIFENG